MAKTRVDINIFDINYLPLLEIKLEVKEVMKHSITSFLIKHFQVLDIYPCSTHEKLFRHQFISYQLFYSDTLLKLYCYIPACQKRELILANNASIFNNSFLLTIFDEIYHFNFIIYFYHDLPRDLHNGIIITYNCEHL